MPLYADITGDDDVKRGKTRAQAYHAYLEAISSFLPEPTREFALSEWYYRDPNKCPHDAWLESVEIFENFSGERHETRNVGIKSRFLSAHHTGHIHFTYEHVFSYDLGCLPQLRRSDGRFVLPKHEDWLADEISLSSSGNVVHEVHFSSGCVWKIEARRVSYLYVPIPGKQLQV